MLHAIPTDAGRVVSVRRRSSRLHVLGAIVGASFMALSVPAAQAAPAVGLGTSGAFALLAGQAITNTGPSVISGNVGTNPGAAVSGFPPGVITNGVIHAADAVSLQAQADLTTAYNDAASRTGAAVGPQLGGQNLTPGVYNGGALNLTGVLTLNGPGVYIFTASSSLITATSSTVNLINGATACNVFWQVTSSATLNGPEFVGTVMALSSITVGNGVHVVGRLLARNGNVTLINDRVEAQPCIADGGSGGGTAAAARAAAARAAAARAAAARAAAAPAAAAPAAAARRHRRYGHRDRHHDDGTGCLEVPPVCQLRRTVRRPVVRRPLQQPQVEPSGDVHGPLRAVPERPDGHVQEAGRQGPHLQEQVLPRRRFDHDDGTGTRQASPAAHPHGAVRQLPALLATT